MKCLSQLYEEHKWVIWINVLQVFKRHFMNKRIAEKKKKKGPLLVSVVACFFSFRFTEELIYSSHLFQDFQCLIIAQWVSNTEGTFIIAPQRWRYFWVFLTVYYVVTSKRCRHRNTYLILNIALLSSGVSSCGTMADYPLPMCVSSPCTSFLFQAASLPLSLHLSLYFSFSLFVCVPGSLL